MQAGRLQCTSRAGITGDHGMDGRASLMQDRLRRARQELSCPGLLPPEFALLSLGVKVQTCTCLEIECCREHLHQDPKTQ
eukprot:1155416-Pelagomonas_calceolata.AAC.1